MSAPTPFPTAETGSPRPVIGVSMGDPAGIGPEIVVKALADPERRAAARWVILGLGESLDWAADRAGIVPYWHRVDADSARARGEIVESVVVLDHPDFHGAIRRPHEPSRAGGLASKTFVERAIADALRPPGDPARLDGIVTAPISKESWRRAGFQWPGHTELLAARTRSKRHAMMFVSPRLRVVLATTHVPLMKLRDLLTIGAVFDPIDLGHAACRRLGIERPRIAVCGLNPHAGEGGLFGDEEDRVIRPAIEAARNAGIDAHGPFPGDTIFIAAAAGDWDLVVGMYHDQGLIPVKLLGWDRAVNWTIGIPIVRTSPDHGTAFDLAGRNRASEGSTAAAMDLAVRLARVPAG